MKSAKKDEEIGEKAFGFKDKESYSQNVLLHKMRIVNQRRIEEREGERSVLFRLDLTKSLCERNRKK